MNQGWVWLHRKILDWRWYNNTNVRSVFIHLLLKANHKDGYWEGRLIKRGQLITGRKVLAKELGLTESKIKTALNKLKLTNEISIEPTTEYSVITINKYNEYNGMTSGIANESPTNDQQIATNNNDNNENNEKNNNTTENFLDAKQEVRKKSKKPTGVDDQYLVSLKKEFPEFDISAQWNDCQRWWDASGKTMSKPRLALYNWLKKARQFAADKVSRPKEPGMYFGPKSGVQVFS